MNNDLLSRKRNRLARIGLVFATVAAGCGPTAPPAEEDVIDVAMQNIAFIPKTVTIRQGQTVRWTNLERLPIPHTATSGRPGDGDAGSVFESGTLNPGQSFRETFNEVGEFIYYCRPHQMTPAMVDAVINVIEE